MEHMQARHRLKQHHRARLGHLGLGFCDDNAARLQKLEQLYADARGIWEAECTLFEPIVAAACHASTTDNELQTIDTTLRNDRLFWSSTGSQTQIADEALLYELDGPACQVHFVRMAVYRAFYQHGYPVYPPMQLQVWAGPSPVQLQPASQVYDVQATDALQTFALDPQAPAARFLQVRMYGKLQKQREDLQFYVAIRHISAVGSVLPSTQLLNLRVLLRSGACGLKPGGQLPGSCVAGLRNMTGWGLCPFEAAAGASAAGRVLDLQPQHQQQQGQNSSSRYSRKETQEMTETEQAVGVAVEQLLVRRQQQQQAGESSKRSNQQQQQPGPGSGFWSALGGGLSRLRNIHAAETSAVGGGDSSSSSASERMHVDEPGAPAPLETASCSAAAAAAGAAGGSSQAIVPKWLQADPAGDPGDNPSSSNSHQQQQLQHRERAAQERRSSSHAGSSSSSADEQGYEADNDTDDQNIGQGGGGAFGDLVGAAEQARMELMLWQALNRLPDPNDPIDREQILAAWLEDEPLHSNIPAALRQQMLQQQLIGTSNASDPQQQQLLPGGWMLRQQPAIMCGSNASSSSSSGGGCGNASSGSADKQWEFGSVLHNHDMRVSCHVTLNADLVLPAGVLSHLVQLPPAAAETAAAALARRVQQSAAVAKDAEGSDSEITVDFETDMQDGQQPGAVRIAGHCLFSVAVGGSAGSSSSSSRCVSSGGWQQSCSWFDEGQEQDWHLQQQLLVA